MTENEYKEKFELAIRIEEAFCMAYNKISDAFKKCYTDAPKKIIRNDLAAAIVAVYRVAEILDVDVDTAIELLYKESEENGGKNDNE